MTDRVYPASKTAAAPTTIPIANTAAPPPHKPNPYNPSNRQSYRRQAFNEPRRRKRNLCCCLCFWSLLIIILIAASATIAGGAIYLLYHPKLPAFSVSALRIAKLNLTSSADTAHLAAVFNLTIAAKNPNNHVSFFFDPFTITAISKDLQLGNGSFPAINLPTKNMTILRSRVSDSQDLDTGSVSVLSSHLKKKSGVPLMIELHTKVKVKMAGLTSKKVGIRVKCDGIKGSAPTGKSPAVASIDRSQCKVDLRITIWN